MSSLSQSTCIFYSKSNLFILMSFKQFGLLEEKVINKYFCLIGKFWIEMFEFTNHSQPSKHNERVNAMLKKYLRHHVITT